MDDHWLGTAGEEPVLEEIGVGRMSSIWGILSLFFLKREIAFPPL